MISAISSFNQNGTSVNLTNNEGKLGAYRSTPALSNSIDTFQKSENLQQKNNKAKLSFGGTPMREGISFEDAIRAEIHNIDINKGTVEEVLAKIRRAMSKQSSGGEVSRENSAHPDYYYQP